MEKLTDILAEVLIMLKNGMSLATDQMPSLIQDFINWGLVKESTHVLMWLIIIIALIIMSNKFNKYNISYTYFVKLMTSEDNPGEYTNKYSNIKDAQETAKSYIIAEYIVYFILFFAIIRIISEIMDIIKILVAPRIYLIEEITNLLSSSKAI